MISRFKTTTQWIAIINVFVSYVFLSSVCLAQEASNQFKSVDFRVDSERNANIIIELNDEQIVVNLQKTPQGLMVELLNTTIKNNHLKRYDVRDFATNVQTFELFRQVRKVQLLAKIEGEFDYRYSLNRNVLEVKISQSQAPNTAKKSSILEQSDKKISINFQDIPVRNVLQLIAEYNDFNLVVSDTVTGNLTLRLDGVPWPQVLDIILQVKGLDKRAEGNVLLVAPRVELAQREKQRLENARLGDELGELKSEIIKVNFANAGDIADMIDGGGSMSMLSERGSITVDERTNSLLIRDLKNNIDVVRGIVISLDIPVKQVQIEARIVTVNEGSLDELGVRWSLNSSGGKVGGSLEGNFYERGLYQGGDSDENNRAAISPDDIGDFLNVNLAAAVGNSSTIAFQVAKLGSGTLLDLELSALQRESKAEVISSPRLITTNKKSAYIEQGTEIPYLESSSSGATSVAFKKAVLSLKVTPQITPDNRLILDLSVTQDRPGEVVKIGTGEAVSINTQRIGTQVLVDNGETVVLGGIFQHSVTDTVDKVPLLGDIPLLGVLFRRSYQKMGKSELLIFVTPKVVAQ
ncbi:type IV pilus secretin PilQ family protein [Vibrio kasasachensis]|uniref:type IV pilus secretin PilQ n=1 Tax=Vibrio kasasachensis TaxID=2910248 RepID=UPI003D0CCC03